MTSKDQYVVMSAAENLRGLANELKRVLGDTEIVQELFANIRLLYSTETMTKSFNNVIAQIAADSECDIKPDEQDGGNCWVNDKTEPAKSYNQVNYEHKTKD